MSRRGNGEGSMFYDEKFHRYQYRVSYIDKYGKLHRKAFYAGKASEARRKAKEWLEFYNQSNKEPSSNPVINKWIQTWLETYVKGIVRPATYEKYVSCLRPVMKTFKDMKLNKLDPTLLQQFFQQQLFSGGKNEQGLSPITVRNQRRYLSSCIDMAVRLGITAKNPVKLTKPPKVEKSEIHPLSEIEVERVLAVALENLENVKSKDNWGDIMSEADLYIGVMIAVFTGMRLGEIMALKWSDLSVNTSFVSVQRSKSDVKGQDITSPKTGNGRKIQIGEALLEALKQHKVLQKTHRKIVGNAYTNNDWIIGGSFGNGYNKRHYSSRKFQKLLKQAKIIRHIRFHDLRHTHATLLLLAGVNPKIVQERLGHASIDMTLDTYSHLTLANQEIAVSALDTIFNKKE
jgi:integrase